MNGTITIHKVLKRSCTYKRARFNKLAFFDRLVTFMVPEVFRSKIGKIPLMIVLLIRQQILAQNAPYVAHFM